MNEIEARLGVASRWAPRVAFFWRVFVMIAREIQMKVLAFPFEWRGFRYELIERQGLVCLVKAMRIGHRFGC
jgi:hypothetical protein